MSLIIKVENVSKQFYINRLRPKELTLGSTVMNVLKKPFTRQHLKLENEVLWALQNISFEVKQGDTLGIIGGNGAGKSTLLKILSRITKLTSGRVKLRGRLGCLIEVVVINLSLG